MQSCGLRIQTKGFRRRRLRSQDDVLLKSGLGISVKQIGLNSCEGVGIDDLIGTEQISRRICQYRNQHAVAAVVVAQGDGPALQFQAVRRVQFNHALDNVPGESYCMLPLVRDCRAIGENVNLLLAVHPLAVLLVAYSRGQLDVFVNMRHSSAIGSDLVIGLLPHPVVRPTFNDSVGSGLGGGQLSSCCPNRQSRQRNY